MTQSKKKQKNIEPRYDRYTLRIQHWKIPYLEKIAINFLNSSCGTQSEAKKGEATWTVDETPNILKETLSSGSPNQIT